MAINTFQKLTVTGKPVINKRGFPVFLRSVETRIKTVKQQLFKGMSDNEARWASIQLTNRIYKNQR